MRIDLVILGFPTMDRFHKESVTENELNAFLPAEVGKPVPGEHAFNTNNQVIPERRYSFEKALRGTNNIAM